MEKPNLYFARISFDVVIAADSPDHAGTLIVDAYTTLDGREFESTCHSVEWMDTPRGLPEGWRPHHVPLFGDGHSTIADYFDEAAP